ncbi:MAG: hypothetical protein HC837_18370 [Chloroflexaceae bacterium]|nr:hypothetical protein [Chloroflexaceae bacterium]
MHSDLIGKIEKARHYANEPERIQLEEVRATFHGSNGDHVLSLQESQWTCNCSFFKTWGTCAHVMAMQKILDPMLTIEARQPDMAVEWNGSDTVTI